MKFLCSLLVKGDVVVDIGSGIGEYVVPFAYKIDNEGYIVAFESHSFVFNMLCGSIAANYLQNVQTFNRAVGMADGVSYFAKIGVPFGRTSKWGGVAHLVNSKDGDGRVYDCPVANISVDSLNLTSPKLIRAHVGKGEEEILQGSVQTIRRSKPILSLSVMTKEMQRLLTTVGYQIKVWHNSQGDNYFLCHVGEIVNQNLRDYNNGDDGSSDFTEIH